jgi:hypothetical protein
VAPVVAVVWLSRSTTTTTGLSVKMFQKEKIGGGRLVGYIHTHTPMDGMGGKQVTEYEGAITFFGVDCSIYVAKKLLSFST